MDRNELRGEIFKYFKSLKQPNDYQLTSLMGYFESKYKEEFLEKDKEVIFDLIQEMINNNIIRSFRNLQGGNGFPWFGITAYGKKCIETENLLPYDPEEFIKEVKNQVPGIDDTVIQYLAESVATYHRNCLLSSTITLGTASEGCMLLLIEAFANAISDTTKQEGVRKKIDGQFINKKYKEFRKHFDPIASTLPTDLIKEADVYLEGIFNFIRINRNEAGHPTGKSLDKKTIYAHHQIFADYAKKMFSLIDYFSTNKI